MNHEDIVNEWKVDSVINENKIQNEITKTPLLHAKYLEYYLNSKGRLIVAEKKYNTMKWVKRKYFTGKMEQHELQERGWSQWQGLKPSNAELNDLFEADRDLNDLEEKVKYYQMMVQGLEYILKSIGQRDWTIKTLFEHQKYMNGGG
jgi:Recombination, repair and ssDNA binding protein UvsY